MTRLTGEMEDKMRMWLVGVIGLAVGLSSPPASARLNPIKQMERAPVRPEVFVLFDASGSMCGRTDASGYSGGDSSGDDCMGNTPGWQVAGDGLCIGYETGADCTAFSPQKCYSTTCQKSRNWRAKEALRNVLPDLRTVANFGLAGYKTHAYDNSSNGYWAYHPVSGAPSGKASIFLHEWELRSSGSWTGAVWDTVNDMPPTSFVKSFGANSVTYTLVNNTDLTTDLNSLYRRSTGTGYTYSRFAWGGLTHNDGTNDWEYVGSFFWYTAETLNTGSYITLTSYQGPRYHDGSGWYEYRRYAGNMDCSSTNQGIGMYSPNGAKFYATLLSSDVQTDHDANMGKLLNAVNTRSNGGIMSIMGGTPGQEAIVDILGHWRTRAAADPLAACRKRTLLVFSDGQFTTGAPKEEIRQLYCEFCNDKTSCNASGPNSTNCNPATSNPITSTVIAVISETSIPSGDRTYLNEASDMGDNGLIDGSTPKALYSSSDKDLVDNIKSAISGAVSGDFVTTGGVAFTSGTTVAGDSAVLPSVEYPGWMGHLRAFDLTQNPPAQMWDAALELNGLGSPYTREIFTGAPDVDSGRLLELLDNSGLLVDETKFKSIATAAGSSVVAGLPKATIEACLRWVYGMGRAWRLPPIIRVVPAVVGAPPRRALKDHPAFESSHSSREQLVYVTSNEGLIHAIRGGKAADGGGDEVFAFLPPNLLDKVYALYQAGGQGSLGGFKWILANSPRVDDVYTGSAWWTQLVVPFGPESYGFVSLDISNPTDSTQPKPYPLATGNDCTPAMPGSTPCVHVRALAYGSSSAATLVRGSNSSSVTLGEARPLPALYWTVGGGGTCESHASLGSGYGAATSADRFWSQTAGHNYNYFGTEWDPPTETFGYRPAVAGTLKVDYATLPDAAAAMDTSGANPVVIAVYQADLDGRIMRYREGKAAASGDRALVIPGSAEAGYPDNASNPFYYPPAVLHVGGSKVVVAAASTSADEASPPSPNLKATLYLRSEVNGTPSATGGEYHFTCAVDTLSSCIPHDSSLNSGPWPTATAKPVAAPVILYSEGAVPQLDIYYMLYEETTGMGCSGGGGDTWLIHVQATNSTTISITEASKLPGRYGGMFLAGGGSNLMLAKSASGAGTATIDNLSKTVTPTTSFSSAPQIELWREVR